MWNSSPLERQHQSENIHVSVNGGGVVVLDGVVNVFNLFVRECHLFVLFSLRAVFPRRARPSVLSRAIENPLACVSG